MEKFSLDDRPLVILADQQADPLLRLIRETVSEARLSGDKLTLRMSGGTCVDIYDGAQDCCEKRYITTDDDIQSLVGSHLMSVTYKRGDDIQDDTSDVHEVGFVDVATTNGTITLCTHNEHNGYYGGFSPIVTVCRTRDD